MSSKMNVCDESLRSDSRKGRVPQIYAREVPRSGRTGASSQPPFSRLDDSVHHRSVQPAVREVRPASALPITSLWSVTRSFHCLSPRHGCAEKGPLGHLQLATAVREGCPHPTIAPDAFSSRTSMARGLSPTTFFWLSCFRLAAGLCPHQSQVYQALVQAVLQRHVKACYGLAELVAPYPPAMCPERRVRKTMLRLVFDNDDDGHTCAWRHRLLLRIR